MTEETKAPLPDQSWRDALTSWPADDRVWLAEKVPEVLQPIAARHGKALYQICMSALVAQQMLTIIAQVPNRAIQRVARDLASIQDGLCRGALKGEGKTLPQFHECKRDVERIVALMEHGQHAPGDRVSPGGIILDS